MEETSSCLGRDARCSIEDTVGALERVVGDGRTVPSSGVVYTIVTETVPTLWRAEWSDTARTRELLAAALRSNAGINAVAMRIRQFVWAEEQGAPNREHLEDLGVLLQTILTGQQPAAAERLADCPVQLLTITLPNLCSEAFAYIDRDRLKRELWIGDPERYFVWLGSAVVGWSNKFASNLFRASIKTTQSASFLHAYVARQDDYAQFTSLIHALKPTELRIFTKLFVSELWKTVFTYTVSKKSDWAVSDAERVGAVASLLRQIYAETNIICLCDALELAHVISMKRSIALAISDDRKLVADKLEACLTTWADPLYIQHSPVRVQEEMTQNILLLFAYVDETTAKELSRSEAYLGGIANRLSSTTPRLAFLAMVVGEAVESMESDDARWYRELITIQDEFRPIEQLSFGIVEFPEASSVSVKPSQMPSVGIEEVKSKEGDITNGIKPYPMPDSDDEDDEDPTVQSVKRSPPLYLRDLLSMLQDNTDYFTVKVALNSAAALIRRNTNFGTALAELSTELAKCLIGLHNNFDIEEFDNMKLQAMTALVAGKPEVGQFLALNFFAGDYSISQRAFVLASVGHGALMLAGVTETPEVLIKPLPGRAAKFYVEDVNKVSEALSLVALNGNSGDRRDAVLQHNHTRRISRRLEKVGARNKPVTNKLAKLVGEMFFFPLAGYWQSFFKDNHGKGLQFEPLLLSLFIRTLSILLNASAPSALSSRRMSFEYWDILLTLQAQQDPVVVEACMLGLLTILRVNDSRELAAEGAQYIIQSQHWTLAVFSSRSDEETSKQIASAVLLTIDEILQKHDRLLQWHT